MILTEIVTKGPLVLLLFVFFQVHLSGPTTLHWDFFTGTLVSRQGSGHMVRWRNVSRLTGIVESGTISNALIKGDMCVKRLKVNIVLPNFGLILIFLKIKSSIDQIGYSSSRINVHLMFPLFPENRKSIPNFKW